MSGQQRVVLDASSFIKGWLIATTLWVGVMLIVASFVLRVPTEQGETDVAQLLGAGLSLAFYGFGLALVLAAPLGWVLAHLLRPVRQVDPHRSVLCGADPGVLGGGRHGGFGWHPGWLGLWAATIGAASAVGRWSIRKDAIISEAEVLRP